MFNKKCTIAAAIMGLSVMTVTMPASAAEVMNPAKGVYVQVLSDCNLPGVPDIQLPSVPENNQPMLPETPVIPEAPEIPDAPETPELPDVPEQAPDVSNPSFAMQVIDLVNQERAKEGLPALQYDASIEKAALVRAKETETSFSHTRPNGSAFHTALTENGVSFRGAGENIAWGQKTPEEVMNGWMNSPGHRANIMDKNFTKIGVGYYQNANGVNYWTQLFTN